MRRSTFLTGLLTAPIFLAPHGRARGSDGLKAWLETTSKGGMLKFQGYVSAPKAMLVSYKLTIKRIGDGGTSSSATNTSHNVVAGVKTYTVDFIVIFGEPDRIRTCDPLMKSQFC